ncbi:MAG: undecaprenyl-phosphate glucose phosphotransferase [Candidatus Sedimenticola sp. (ex Thyasira tokunagai)]
MKHRQRSLLQRRSSIFSTIQSLSDGSLIIGVVYGLALVNFGHLPPLYLMLGLALMAITAIVYDHFGVYSFFGGYTKKALLIGKAWTISFAILLTIGFLSKTSELFSRQFLATLFFLGFIGQQLVHITLRYLHSLIKSNQSKSQSIIIGTDQLAGYLYQRINRNPWLGEHVIGLIETDSDTPEGERKNDEQLPILGNLSQVTALVDQHNIRTVYIAVSLDSSPLINDIYFSLLDKNVDVHWAPNIFALNLLNHSVKELSGIPIITLSETPLAGTSLLLKAVEDKFISLFVLLLLSPLMLLTAVAIKLDSRGPVFFKQERTGWDGRSFKIWKFRSMRSHNPEEGLVEQATRDDPRFTRIGKFIRRTSIDELPQLFNVLDGTMSLVGPRPHAISHNKEYSKQIEAYLTRHRIKPGITGLAQVRGHRGETKELDQMVKRVESDLEYINNWSIWLDISILFRTLSAPFQKGAY